MAATDVLALLAGKTDATSVSEIPAPVGGAAGEPVTMCELRGTDTAGPSSDIACARHVTG